MRDKVVVHEDPSITAVNKGSNDEQKVVVNDAIAAKVENPKDSYEGRKYEPNIDGPEQASQETDEVFVDPRKEEDLPAGGKNVGELNAFDLSQNANVSSSVNNDI